MHARALFGWKLASLLVVAAPLQAQTLATRITDVGTGSVIFHFTPRPGVCGDGQHFIRTGRSSYHGSFTTGRPMEPCVFGPVQVRVTLENGAPNRLQSWVGPLRSREARDLGVVPAPEAARYLMTLASQGIARVSDKAIMPAVLADSATVWPALLTIARDMDTRSRGTRQEAVMWLSRFASAAVSGRPNELFALDDEEGSADDDVKSNAVFVLSQLPHREGVPMLLEVARTNPNHRVRSQAMFWLGQSGDPRAIDLFEAELRAKAPR
jgi:hypothetical protein